ncbi:MAG: DUF192 domain-containing protein [Arenicella sp.]|nr:DUF192 domain-containing protein [Arenicella sp.]
MNSLFLNRFSMAVFLILITGPALAGDRDPALAGFFAQPLVIESAAGDRHKFTAYLAMTPYQRAHGLMFVRKLPADYGMLFLHEQPKIVSMWMKNTVLSLDMLFIRSDGTVASIAHDTVPGSLETISSDEEVTGVLELNAGTAKRLRLAAGDRIVYRAFARQSGTAVSPASDPR